MKTARESKRAPRDAGRSAVETRAHAVHAGHSHQRTAMLAESEGWSRAKRVAGARVRRCAKRSGKARLTAPRKATET